MNPTEFAQIVALGHEQNGVEFKHGGSRKNRRLQAQVLRAMMGMANRADGGYVILGVDENNNKLELNGVAEDDLASWNHDDLSATLAEYADPSIDFTLEIIDFQGKQYIVLSVKEFDEVPILCKRDYPDVLQAGLIYVRARRKSETTPIPTLEDMRRLIDLATDKAVVRYVKRRELEKLAMPSTKRDLQKDSSQFEEQIADLNE